MAGQQVFYLTNSRLVALVVRRGAIVARACFPATQPGHEGFERLARARRDLPARLIVDLVEEQFRIDAVPHLRGRDREAVIKRRLGQAFPATPYRHAMTQGREPEGRRGDLVVCAAVTSPALLTPWLDALERAEVALQGAHSAALLSPSVLAMLGLSAPNVLLISRTPCGALRQTFVRHGHLRLSRLTPGSRADEAAALGERIAAEAARTWQHLDSTRAFPAGERLDVWVLMRAGERPAVESRLREAGPLRPAVLSLEWAVGRLGLRPSPEDDSAEALFAAFVARRRVPNHYARPEHRRHATLGQARLAINAAAVAAAAAGLANGGLNIAQGIDRRDLGFASAARVAALAAERNDIVTALPPLSVAASAMRETADLHDKVLREYPHPAAFLAPISAVLSRHPEVRLQHVSWRSSDDGITQPSTAPGSDGDRPAGGSSPNPAAYLVLPALPAGRYAVAVLDATVPMEGGAYRAALARVDRLVADLAALPEFQASIIHSPLNVSPSARLEARLGEGAGEGPTRGAFTVRVVWARPPRP